MLIRMMLLSVFAIGIGVCVQALPADDLKKPSPSAKPRDAEIRKLIEQLNAESFKVREEATRRLMQRDDARPQLHEAAKSEDAEVRRRAQKAIEAIDKRLGKRAIQRAIAKLKKGQTDQFVDAVGSLRGHVDEDCWKAALEHAQAIADKAGKLNGGREYKALPRVVEFSKLKCIDTDVLRMPVDSIFQQQRVIAERVKMAGNIARDAFLICRGPVDLEGDRILAWSVLLLNGDLKIGDPDGHHGGILDSIVVCDRTVSTTTFVSNSVILARGNVNVGGPVENCVIMSGGEVKIAIHFPDSVAKNSVIQERQKAPLDFIHFFDLAEHGIEVQSSRQEVRVEGVAVGKCFAQAGIRKGDRILAVDGVKVASVEACRRLLRRRLQESKAIRVEIQRQDKRLYVNVCIPEDAP